MKRRAGGLVGRHIILLPESARIISLSKCSYRNMPASSEIRRAGRAVLNLIIDYYFWHRLWLCLSASLGCAINDNQADYPPLKPKILQSL